MSGLSSSRLLRSRCPRYTPLTPQLGFLQHAAQASVVARKPLGINEETEALVEGERGKVGLSLLCGPALRHRVKAQRLEFFNRRFIEH